MSKPAAARNDTTNEHSLDRWRPYPTYRDSGVGWLGKIPGHWIVTKVKFGYIIRLGKMLQNDPASPTDKLEPYLRSANISWEGVDLSEVKEMWFSEHEKTQYALTAGDLIVCEGGDVGRSAIWKGELANCYIQNAVHRVRSSTDFSNDYLYYWLYLLKYAGYIDLLCNKATISHFTVDKLKNIELVTPSLSEQWAIAKFLDRETAKIDALIAKKQQLIGLLHEQRSAIISHVVTKGLDPSVPMRDSGIHWLGDIPAHWGVTKLMYLTEIDRPIMYGIVLPGPNVEEGIPIVKGGDVAPGRLRLEHLNRTTYEIESKYERSRLKGGDIVYAIRGSIGMAELVPHEIEGANLTQDAARIAPKKQTVVRWLLYAVKSRPFFAQLDARAIGATIRGINIRDLKRGYVPLPPFGEQAQIALRLDSETSKIDQLTSKTLETIEKLREYRAALISAAVTGKIDVHEEMRDYDVVSED